MKRSVFRRPYRNITELIELAPYAIKSNLHRYTAHAELLYADLNNVRSKIEASGRRYKVDSAQTWLRGCGAVISDAQLAADFVPNDVSLETVCTGFRPPRYGRAAIFESSQLFDLPGGDGFEDRLLVDVKGCGVMSGVTPLPTKNQSGLLPLHLAIAEVINSKILDHIFSKCSPGVACVPIFGIVSLGFSARVPEGPQVPAVTLIRQVHLRPEGNIELPEFGSREVSVKQKIEDIIFENQITSTGHSNVITINFEDNILTLRVGGVKHAIPESFIWRILDEYSLSPPIVCFPTNIQIAYQPSLHPLEAEIVDLSHYKLFHPPPSLVTTLVSDRPFNFGEMRARNWQQTHSSKILQGAKLKDKALSADPRYDKIKAALPGWLMPDTKISAVMIEAAYITSMIVSEKLNVGEVGALIDKFTSEVIVS